jgi:cytochrome c553
MIGLRVFCGYNRPLRIKTRYHTLMRIRNILPLLMLCLLSTSAFAGGDYKAGKIKAYTCTGCHGIVGYNNTYPTYHVPRIGGQNKEYLVIALKAFRSGERHHKSMNLQAEALSDQDIEDISVYLAAQTNKKGTE